MTASVSCPAPPFETDRMRVRDWAGELRDPHRRQALEATLAGLLTPAVLAPLPEPLQLAPGPSALSDWLSARAGESHVYTARRKADDTLLGLLILASIDEEDAKRSIHLGYLFAETAWGQGYATELISGLLAALAGRGRTRLIGGVARANPASIRVLEKAGFSASAQGSTDDTVLYTRSLP